MLRALTKQDRLSLLGLTQDNVPAALLLRGARNLNTNYEKHRTFFSDIVEVGSRNGIFEDAFIGSLDGVLVGYASVYGDAMASDITHVFGVLGTRLVVQTGCCGALGEGILPGDLVCATSAHCGEGAACYYLAGEADVEASPELVSSLATRGDPVAMHRGPVWTTFALLAEGKTEIQAWGEVGYLAVDMESATTFAVAKHFGMQRLSLLFAFDNPRAGEHIMLTDAAKAEPRARGERGMIDLAMAVIAAHRHDASAERGML